MPVLGSIRGTWYQPTAPCWSKRIFSWNLWDLKGQIFQLFLLPYILHQTQSTDCSEPPVSSQLCLELNGWKHPKFPGIVCLTVAYSGEGKITNI